MLIINHQTVQDVLAGRENEVIDLISRAYAMHDEGQTVVPHSVFLRFPDNARNRIIGLPSYLGGETRTAGMKWISSFPGNIERGQQRASAAMILNSMETGHPEALLEASLISAKRTAASAALGARLLAVGKPQQHIGLIGCGVINLEVLRFVAAGEQLTQITLYDSDPARAQEFAGRCTEIVPAATVTVATTADEALAHGLVSIATNAGDPHMDLDACAPGTIVLHISLRDLTTATILANHNVVDDPDHVLRERTSLHLAEQEQGNRNFIDASIGQLVRGTVEFTPDPANVLIFSPFGLGVLDLALADFVRTEAIDQGLGVSVDDFLPAMA